MPHTAFLATACVLNGRLHVIGAMDSSAHQVLEMTEENGLAWTVKADLPANRFGAASAMHEGKIWVVGGIVGGESSASVLTYEPDADAWATAPSLPLPTLYGTATAIDGGIVFCADLVYQYKNAAWSAVPGGMSIIASTCGTALLG